jgi:acyl-coenzyme A thioesterase PaaI-like protein
MSETSGVIRTEGRVLNAGRRVATAEARITDAKCEITDLLGGGATRAESQTSLQHASGLD